MLASLVFTCVEFLSACLIRSARVSCCPLLAPSTVRSSLSVELVNGVDYFIMLPTLAVLFIQSIILSSADELKPPNGSLPSVPTPQLNLTALLAASNLSNALPVLPPLPSIPTPPPIVPCTCGVFLTGQFVKGSHKQPTGYPALLHEYETPFACSPAGQKQCANKCLEVIARHLPHSGTIVCGTIDRDCFKERAYLWTKNCNDVWVNSNMSAGKEFCCKDGLPYKCPLGNH